MRPLLYALPLLAFVLQGPSSVATFPTGKVEARGACDIRADSVACWDMDGKPSAELGDSVRTALSNNGQEVQFRLGKKNRYLVVRRPQSLGVSYRISTTEGVYGNFNLNGDPMTEFLRVSANPSDTQVTLHATATVQADKDVDLSLREGSRATIEGWNVEVGASQKVPAKKGALPPNRNYGYAYSAIPPGVDSWTLVVGLTGPSNEYVNWAYTPLDVSGAPIRYVDADGRPLSAIKALALEPSLQPNNGSYPTNGNEAAPAKKPKASVAVFQGVGQAPAFRAVTNIDPKWIATLRIRASHQENADLGPFPLDPR